MAAKVAAIFDLDGTITTRDTYLSFLLHFLAAHPQRVLRTGNLPLAVGMYSLRLRSNHWLKRIFLESVTGGIQEVEMRRCVEPFLARVLDRGIRPGAAAAIAQHIRAGDHLVLATASFDIYAQRLGESLGFDAVLCTQTQWDSNRRLCLPETAFENCHGEAKLGRVRTYFQSLGQTFHHVVYSDHHSDIPLLQWADRAIAVNPTRRLRQLAVRYGYEVRKW